MSDDAVVRMDDRGRVTLGGEIRRRGVEPAGLWRLTFLENQKVMLTPIEMPE